MEIMDSLTLEAAEAAVQPGYPQAGAILLVELDGNAVQVEDDAAHVEEICRSCGATELRVAETDAERARFWKGRKAAFAAMGRVSHDYYVQDGVVPRTKLPEVLDRIGELEREYGLRVGNVFHAGDGNLHPLVLYDRRNEGEAKKAKELAEAILEACMDAGGSLTGEHGMGAHQQHVGCRSCSQRPISPSWTGSGVRSTRRACATRERSCRRRACAAKCPGPTGRTPSSWPALPSASEGDVAETHVVSVGPGSHPGR